jgi:hypothetical protein
MQQKASRAAFLDEVLWKAIRYLDLICGDTIPSDTSIID